MVSDRAARYGSPRLLAVVTFCLAAAASVGLVHQLAGSGRASADPTPPQRVSTRPVAAAPGPPATTLALVSWVRANLSTDSRLATDPAAAALLQAAGYGAVTHDLTTCRPGTLIVLTVAVHRSAASDPAVQNCIDRSYAVASLGTVEVRDVASDLAAAMHDRADALADRKRAGAALADNPAIAMPAAVRTKLLAGQLDLRAAAVLAGLSAHMSLHLQAIDGVAAELRAGMPARTVEIGTSDPAAVQPVLDRVVAAYRPQPSTQTPAGGLQLTWPFRIDPPPVLS